MARKLKGLAELVFMDAPHTVPHFVKHTPSPAPTTSHRNDHVCHTPAALHRGPAHTASSAAPADLEAGTRAGLEGAVDDDTADPKTVTDPPEGGLQLVSLESHGSMGGVDGSTGHAGSSSCPQPRRAWLLPPELYGTATGEQGCA